MSFNDNVTLDTSQVRAAAAAAAAAPGGMVGRWRHRRHHHPDPHAHLRRRLRRRRRRHRAADRLRHRARSAAAGDQDAERVRAVQDRRRRQQATPCAASSARSTRCRPTGPASCRGTARSDSRRKTVHLQRQTQSACGTASNQVGPFYCPLDKQGLHRRELLQDPRGPVRLQRRPAREGVRHRPRVRPRTSRTSSASSTAPSRTRRAPNSGAVRIELMADCLAGVWVKHARPRRPRTPARRSSSRSPTRTSRTPSRRPPPVGDDRIQEKTQGRVNPESWTHGSAEARQRWFLQGYKTGDLNQCDTFSAATVELSRCGRSRRLLDGDAHGPAALAGPSRARRASGRAGRRARAAAGRARAPAEGPRAGVATSALSPPSTTRRPARMPVEQPHARARRPRRRARRPGCPGVARSAAGTSHRRRCATGRGGCPTLGAVRRSPEARPTAYPPRRTRTTASGSWSNRCDRRRPAGGAVRGCWRANRSPASRRAARGRPR